MDPSFPVRWKTVVGIFFVLKICRLWIYLLHLSENTFIFFLFLRDTLSRYKILSWWLFFFKSFKEVILLSSGFYFFSFSSYYMQHSSPNIMRVFSLVISRLSPFFLFLLSLPLFLWYFLSFLEFDYDVSRCDFLCLHPAREPLILDV